MTQQSLDKKVVRFVVQESMPFSIVESESFRDLVLAGLPGKRVMSVNTVNERLTAGFQEMKKSMTSEMASVDHIAVTADCGTATSRSYLGMTAHCTVGVPAGLAS